MAKFHNLLVMALVIIRRIHKGHITDRGAENPTGPKLPDFTLHAINHFQYAKENHPIISNLQL